MSGPTLMNLVEYHALCMHHTCHKQQCYRRSVGPLLHHDGQNGRSHHDGRNHHEAQIDQTGYSPIPNNNRKFQEPPVYNPSPSNPPHPHQNNDISHGHGVGPGARRRQSEHTVHPHESSTIPQRTGAQPKPPSKQAIDQKRSAHFSQLQILRRLKMRKETVWSIKGIFDRIFYSL